MSARRSGRWAETISNGRPFRRDHRRAVASQREDRAERIVSRGQLARPPEEPALPVEGAERQCPAQVVLGLDPLGEDQRAGPLRLGVDRVDDFGDLLRGAVVQQFQVELDHVGAQERDQGERARVGADVVEGDPGAAPAQVLGQRDQVGGVVGEGALGQLDDQREAVQRVLQ